jgi:hypothetical protein
MSVADAGVRPPGERTRAPWHLWLVGILALLWNAMGAFDYLATQMRWEPYMSQFGESELAYFYGIPAWAVAAWAIAVWGGLLASVGLLLRKRWAVLVFGLSLAGLAVSTLHTFGLSEGAEVMGTTGAIFTAVIWIIAILLFFYARAQAKKGVLR